MQKAVGMGVIQRGGNLQRQRPHFGPWHGAVVFAPGMQRATVAILHRVVENPVVQRAVVHHRNPGMVQAAHRARLAQKPLRFLLVLLAAAVEQFLADHLERVDPA